MCNILGLWTYNKYMKEWNYQTIFLFSNLPPDFSLKLEVFSYRLRGEAGGGAR